jgi:murein DD-endopeptidase MepM/ murein hydrolase activator NlpD
MATVRRRTHAVATIAASLGVVLVAGLLGAPVGAANSITDRQKQLNRDAAAIREQLEGTSGDLVDAAIALHRSQAALVGARAAEARAEAALAAARNRDAEVAAQLAFTQAQADKTAADLGSRRAQEADTRTTLGRIAREAYLTSGLSGLAVAFDADSPQQFADRVTVAGTALRAQNSAIGRLQVMEADIRAQAALLGAVQVKVTELKRQSAMAVAERRADEEAAANAAASVAALVHTQAAAVALISARKAAEQARLNALERQQARLRAILAARARAEPGGRSVARSGHGYLSFPVNAPITSGFGMRFHPVLHYWRLHAGTDFGAPCGTPVHAAADGVVVRAGYAGGFGNQVVLDHGRVNGVGLATSYNHLSRFVRTGGRVERGEVIAYSGTTGLSTGCHLHFEVYVNGEHVNPMRWL